MLTHEYNCYNFIHLHNVCRLTSFKTQTALVIFKIDNVVVLPVHGTVQHSEKMVVRIVMAKGPSSEVQQLLASEEMHLSSLEGPPECSRSFTS